MTRTMIQAATTLNQLQNKLDVIGNNLANTQTTGYKNRNSEFASLLFQQINQMNDPANAQGRLTPDGLRVGSGAKLTNPTIDLTLGSIKQTGRSLDIALLEENHLFQLQVTEDGQTETRYTRDGSFYLNPTEDNSEVLMLTSKDGHPVIGVNGPIMIQDGFDGIDILENGQVTVRRGEFVDTVGQLAVVEAVRPRFLEASGNNLFRLPDVEGYNAGEIIQATGTRLQSQALETSNVDISKQMTDLLMTQRAYQFNARTISTTDQMMGLINQLR
ncbi:flagellar hook-basal body protein [Ornithinibacillus halophilus]|uniref:Flagellar basal-body rod protein FlgG n=1 Tax=Ornithinibacillus halophilus TaxID=930117 RepID=A0A1M5N6D1_9BACI|nr:flagellar hook-basal body protein [Ornithinibacillus halophilus]SHG85146.1 flagellar basal-body rod protein FlgG [Ornithinibacillus halophilus]